MFFDKISEIPEIAERVGCAVFVVPEDTEVTIKNAFVLKPETRTIITIEQVREVLRQLTVKQNEPRFVMIRPADKLGEEAENAILKNLEEPKENVHFVLITNQLSRLLPTILSRSAVYIWQGGRTPINEIRADEKLKVLAKKLLSASPKDLPSLAEELTHRKDGVREYVLKVLELAIEMAYKSYFVTEKQVFLTKIPKLIFCYENIVHNGHIKLHLVADLI